MYACVYIPHVCEWQWKPEGVRLLGARVMGECHLVCRGLRIILWSFGRASSASGWLLEFFLKNLGQNEDAEKSVF